MKKLLIKLLLFISIIWMSLNSLFYLLRNYDTIYYNNENYNWIEHPSITPKVIIMGSSTAAFGLNPSIISKYTNYQEGEIISIANLAQTPLQAFHIWRKHLSKKRETALIFYVLDPWILTERYYLNDNFTIMHWSLLQRLYFYLPGILIDPITKKKIITGTVVQQVLTTILDNLLKKENPRPETLQIPENFGAKINLNKLKKNNKPIDIRAWFEPFKLFPFSQLHLKSLKKLKDDIENSGGKFILVLPPYTKKLQEEYQKTCPDIERIFSEKLNQVMGPTKIIGSFKLIDTDKEEQYFADTVHLNQAGQQYFSKFLSLWIKNKDFGKPKKIQQLLSY